jgi:endonuclease/exonuclease/phosphatase family metal-dependent hydrolase
VPLVVRTWNLFHGNASPPERRGFLRTMVELVTADRPDIVCLQELDVWALSHLEHWSGMRVVSAIARPPLLGSAELGRWITALDHGLFRSAFTGEADAILLAAELTPGEEHTAVVSTSGLRRIAHSARVDDGIVVVNFHITGDSGQLERVREFAADNRRVIVAGDTNLPGAGLDGFSAPLAESIDQILVRGLPSTPPVRWPDERRRLEGRLLSDHAPVELTVG